MTEKETHSGSIDIREEFMKVLTNNCRLYADIIMLRNKKIKNVDVDYDGKIDGFQFGLANPLNTAQPMSAVRDLRLSIDGAKVEPEKISLVLRKNTMSLKDASTIPELWWGYGESISVFVEKAGGLTRGRHQLDCSLVITPAFYTFFPENTVFPAKVDVEVE